MQARSDGRDLIPVTVLTGFLGSGKTTLLARLVKHPDLTDMAIIINEFGEVGLDHLLVTKGDENMVLLESGCLCCTISNSLGETLGDLHFRRARREVPPFRRVLVETTGLADPAPILHTLMTDYLVTAHFIFDGIVVTVDGTLGDAQLDEHEEAVKQAALADRIIITKVDIAERGKISELRRRIAALNPSAAILKSRQGDLDPRKILDIGPLNPAQKSLDVARWLREETLAGQDHEHSHAMHRHDAHHHDARINSFCLYLDDAATWRGYAAWLEAIRSMRGADLLRVKGLLAIEDSARPYVIQGVQHAFSPPVRLPEWPSADHRSRLIFITRDLERTEIELMLRLLGDPAAVWRKPVDRAQHGGAV
ncbi:MAG TPA: GTP-binding protein [Stellaceae bacterium]|nr:GTP-binding protein [Stellaceae bacterium]